VAAAAAAAAFTAIDKVVGRREKEHRFSPPTVIAPEVYGVSTLLAFAG